MYEISCLQKHNDNFLVMITLMTAMKKMTKKKKKKKMTMTRKVMSFRLRKSDL